VVTLTKSDRIWGSDFFSGPRPRHDGCCEPAKERGADLDGHRARRCRDVQSRRRDFHPTQHVKKELAGSTAKLARFEVTVGAARSHPNEIKDGADARMLASAGSIPRAPLILTRDEIQLILAVIKVPPPPPGAAPKINVGDLLPDTALAPLPEPITRKVPKLLGARFAVDRNRAIVVVAPGTNRVEIIINPS
jgi:hypothetical protein